MTVHPKPLRIALLGSGIATSLSPLIHTTEAAALGLSDYRYDLLDLTELGRAPDEAGDVLRDAAARGYTGFNVTFPCKQTVLSRLDETSATVDAVGAANTVLVTADGRLVGHNTDYSGFLRGLRRGLRGVAMHSVVQTGAGGAGAAVAHALATAGVRRLCIIDPDGRRAEELAAAVRRRTPACDAVGRTAVGSALAGADGLVNASPIGMEGHPGIPVDAAALHADLWVADIVYRPIHTPLLRAAAERGCRTLDGLQMLLGQAVETFHLLTGLTPDADRMGAHLHATVSGRAALAS